MLSYGLKLSGADSVSFSGDVYLADNTSDELVVSVIARSDARPDWKTLWSQTFSADAHSSPAGFSGSAPLDYPGESFVELAFLVESSASDDKTYVIWSALDYSTTVFDKKQAGTRGYSIPEGIENCIIIITDASNIDYFGCYNEEEESLTGNIDTFAKNALLFRHAIAPGAQTAKSVSTMFSGIYPDYHGVFGVETAFPAELKTLPLILKESGFHTVAFAGIRVITTSYNLSEHFDEVFDLRTPEAIAEGSSEMRLDIIQAKLRELAGTQAPKFIYIHLLPPHWPYSPPEPFGDETWKEFNDKLDAKVNLKESLKFGMADKLTEELNLLKEHYRKNVRYADYLAGEILATLEAEGYFENSLIMLTADHGEEFGNHDYILHGHTVYDDAIRVPLIVHIPDGAADVVDQQVGLVDVLPTVSELFDLEHGLNYLQGRSLVPLLFASDIPPEDYY
jgi:arylsulfatase A-like enzyme